MFAHLALPRAFFRNSHDRIVGRGGGARGVRLSGVSTASGNPVAPAVSATTPFSGAAVAACPTVPVWEKRSAGLGVDCLRWTRCRDGVVCRNHQTMAFEGTGVLSAYVDWCVMFLNVVFFIHVFPRLIDRNRRLLRGPGEDVEPMGLRHQENDDGCGKAAACCRLREWLLAGARLGPAGQV